MTENDNENEYKIYCARTSYEHNMYIDDIGGIHHDRRILYIIVIIRAF